jgi:hypothetical protein
MRRVAVQTRPEKSPNIMRVHRVRRNQGGFTPVELPMVLLVAAVLGLLCVLFCRLLLGSIAWYGWLAGGLGVPLLFLLVLAIAAQFTKREK